MGSISENLTLTRIVSLISHILYNEYLDLPAGYLLVSAESLSLDKGHAHSLSDDIDIGLERLPLFSGCAQS